MKQCSKQNCDFDKQIERAQIALVNQALLHLAKNTLKVFWTVKEEVIIKINDWPYKVKHI